MPLGTDAGSLVLLAGLLPSLFACTRSDDALGGRVAPGGRVAEEAAAAHDHDCSQHEGPAHEAEEVRGVLARADRGALTTLRVTAHVGAATLRKRDGVWRTAGARSCEVSNGRILRALDNLSALRATPSSQSLQMGARFELQIDALVDERHVLHLEVAGRHQDGDLARLRNDETVVLRGLDRSLWLPDPGTWCQAP